MIAVQGTYDNGAIELLNPAPMTRADVLIIFPDSNVSANLEKNKEHFVDSRFGVAKGKFVVPDDIDSENEEIARLFEGSL